MAAHLLSLQVRRNDGTVWMDRLSLKDMNETNLSLGGAATRDWVQGGERKVEETDEQACLRGSITDPLDRSFRFLEEHYTSLSKCLFPLRFSFRLLPIIPVQTGHIGA